jgi:hypothetical protein
MNNPKSLAPLFIFILVLSGCKNSDNKSGTEIVSIKRRDNSQNVNPTSKINFIGTKKSKKINTEASTDFSKVKVLRVLYVLKRSGLDYKELPIRDARTLGRLEYGDQLEVIKDTNDWLGVREYTERGLACVYVKKAEAGPITKNTVSPSDLMVAKFSEKINLSKILEIKLISKSEYLFNKDKSSKYFFNDTVLFKKKKGVLRLKIRDGFKVFNDLPTESEEKTGKYNEEYSAHYNYIGQYQFLNEFLVSGDYYENSDFEFVNKSNGKIDKTFTEFPFVSFDKKHIVVIYSNPYDLTADLELFSINNEKIIRVMSASFSNWMPALSKDSDKNEIFWGTDNCIYTRVVHSKAFWNENGGYNDNYQYLKIRIK